MDSFPLQCDGDGGDCQFHLALCEIKEHLSTIELDDFLAKSYEFYLQTHPRDFKHCGTPDCSGLYYPTLEEAHIVCSSCLLYLCTKCGLSHHPLTCEEFRNDQAGGNEGLARYLATQPNVKQCPDCVIDVQKLTGCDHMECGACKEHFCWVCLDKFGKKNRARPGKEFGSIGLTYVHLDNVHGSRHDAQS